MSGGHGLHGPKFIRPLTHRLATKQLARSCHRIDTSDIAVSADCLAQAVGKIHAAINNDVEAFRDLTLIVLRRSADFAPKRT